MTTALHSYVLRCLAMVERAFEEHSVLPTLKKKQTTSQLAW